MNMEQMKKAWWDREKRIHAWAEKLFDSAYALRDEVTSQLNPVPAQFKAGDISLNVIEAFQPGLEGNMLDRMSESSLEHLTNDVLRFSIGVYFERSPGSMAKTVVLIPAAVRAYKHSIEWCLWDAANDAPSETQAWTPNKILVAAWVAHRLEMMLKRDPMHGPEFKTEVAFLGDQVLH